MDKESLDEMAKLIEAKKNFGEMLLELAIDTAQSDDERLAFMILRKASEISNIVMHDFAAEDTVKSTDFETKKNTYAYLCAVADGLKEFIKQLKDGDIL